MKERVIIAFAICVLFLSACGSLVGTSTPSSSSAPHPKAPIATASMQSACQILHNRQAQLNLEYHTASTQLAAAQAHGNWQQRGAGEKMLLRLHQVIVQVRAQAKACS